MNLLEYGFEKTKKPPLGGYDITAYYFDFIWFSLLQKMVPGAGLEPAQP